MSTKAYEKEKDVLLHEIELNEDYLSICDANGGWNRFIKIGHLQGKERLELIKHYIDIGEFAGLVRFSNQQTTPLSESVKRDLYVLRSCEKDYANQIGYHNPTEYSDRIEQHIQAQANEIKRLKGE
jgi:hypothetical protein